MTRETGTALLVIDAQESFRQRPDDWAATANPLLLANIARLVDHARAAGDIVAWVTHSEPGTGGVFDPSSGFVRVFAELDPRDDEIQVTKTTVNAFTSTDLQHQLTARGVRRVVICGIRTEQCCETTARVAGDLGFDVEFVTDATTTSAIGAGPGYGAVSGEELMRRTESVLGARGFATIVTTAERTARSVAA
ncbi:MULTISPECIES: isochorismatase family protein [unclassified Microbacterium]|uniref:isochorismatase family protein n=1 Tax=unclassified Microbacterium TaxID=2609290 RepID=UPI00214B9E02|nr:MULTISPECIES: isochorismatase family protein [unclassified Microbacterium]MCR2785937.1 isochorismatase family protein [Microbacterium sp. zg.B96]WIM17089.1 isochorismatase family protein [Microbacterium sp. zg-B96]